MKIRKYKKSDCVEICKLFFETVHNVNALDYSAEEINAWAPVDMQQLAWQNSLASNHAIVAEENGETLGFGDITNNGYLDRLYIHKDHQRKGIASLILKELETHATSNGISSIETHSSKTAMPFFLSKGYVVLRENIVIRKGVNLKNYIMEKHFGNAIQYANKTTLQAMQESGEIANNANTIKYSSAEELFDSILNKDK